jgi:hypothetical protein
MKEDGGCYMEEDGLSSTRIGFSLRAVHVGFLIYKVALGHVYFRAFNFLWLVSFQKSYILIN